MVVLRSAEPTIRQRLYSVIFEHDTRAGRAFDVAIVTVELNRAAGIGLGQAGRVCEECGKRGHDADASYCKHCGALMPV